MYSKGKVRERIQRGKILPYIALLERFGCRVGNRSARTRAGSLRDAQAWSSWASPATLPRSGLGAVQEDGAGTRESSL